MLISQIFWMLKQYLVFAILGVVCLAIVFSIGYFFIYKKVLKGQKRLNIKSTLITAVFTCYILMVLYATLFSRESMGYCSVNLDLFSSYREAWNKFTLRGWQLLILNIVMFVPFGILLPLMNNKFKKLVWTASAGALFTLFIETVQLVFNLGVFEVDDLINNFVGAIIGYGLIMSLLTVIHKEKFLLKKTVCYLLPLLLVCGGYAGIFIKYNMNELGNLSEAYSQQIKFVDTKISTDIELSKKSQKDVIYKTKVYDKKTALIYAREIYKKLGVPTNDLKTVQYNDFAVYSSEKDSGYYLGIEYIGGKFYYMDYSLDKYKPLNQFNKEMVISAFDKINMIIPKELDFEKQDQEGEFSFKADMVKYNDKYLLGEIRGVIYNDGIIRQFDHSLVTLEKYKDVDILSEFEAFEKIRQGKFNIYLEEELESLKVLAVDLEYRADSKGFYQPVYKFKVKINGEENFIAIPATR